MSALRLSTFIILLFYSFGSFSQQSKAELEKQQKKIKENIEYTEKLLKQIKQDSKTSASQMELIKKKINQREALIQTLTEEVTIIDQKINETEDVINALERDVQALKEDYAKMVVQAYKTRSSTDRMMFVFSSSSFDQAFRRMKYLQALSEYRQQQAEAIIKTQQSLANKRAALEGQRAEKNELINAQSQEKQTLGSEKEQKEKKLKELDSQESKYKKELVAAQKKDNEIRLAIKKIITDEINRRNAELNKSTGAKPGSPEVKAYKPSPEEIELGNSFAANKGKLPWPVDKGEITLRFGEQPHAFLKGILIKKDGVTFATTEGTRARAVYDGQVQSIMIIPGAGKIVIIKHGEYVTVYTNLKETFVSTGDKVKTKEEIGVIITDKGETETEFQLWRGTTLIDPSYWIYKAR